MSQGARPARPVASEPKDSPLQNTAGARELGAEPELQILYEDAAVIAVDKPSGLLIHREAHVPARVPVLVDLLRRLLGVPTVFPVHRLDRGTSGVVLFARDSAIAAELGAMMEARAVEKHYLALVRGDAPEELVIDHPIPRRRDGPRVEAVTKLRCLAQAPTSPRTVSLLDLRPSTGRRHQLRRHLRHANYPIIGDTKYGDLGVNRALREGYGLSRLALHASTLSLLHPTSGERLRITAPLPAELREAFLRMDLDLSCL